MNPRFRTRVRWIPGLRMLTAVTATVAANPHTVLRNLKRKLIRPMRRRKTMGRASPFCSRRRSLMVELRRRGRRARRGECSGTIEMATSLLRFWSTNQVIQATQTTSPALGTGRGSMQFLVAFTSAAGPGSMQFLVAFTSAAAGAGDRRSSS